jgi:hypothetical protein
LLADHRFDDRIPLEIFLSSIAMLSPEEAKELLAKLDQLGRDGSNAPT